MVSLTYKNNRIPLSEDQSVLDALLEAGCAIPNACKQGVCQSCLMQAEHGEVPSIAQIGLKPTQQAQGYFLSCLCKPQQDLEISDPQGAGAKIAASIVSVSQVTPSIYVLRLRIADESNFVYKAGQYVNLIRPQDQLTRSYSLASCQSLDGNEIELHIKSFPGGEMSPWLASLKTGVTVELMGPMGECFYLSDFRDNPLLLLGYGTGLAPLYGILREALDQGHVGDIHLYHWGNVPDDLYYQEELAALVKQHANVSYVTGLDGDPESLDVEGHMSGDACVAIQQAVPDLKKGKIFLCGGEAKVNKARRVFYLAGADLSNIYADAFFTWQKSDDLKREVS